MNVMRGRTRLVVAFPKLGFVVKFPVVLWFKGLKAIAYCLRGRSTRLQDEIFKYNTDHHGSVKSFLFKGIVNNWREYRLYRGVKSPFLQPTYCSLFGLLNVQEYGEPCGIDRVDLWCQLHDLTNGNVFANSHTFSEPENFCFREGKLSILDYGGYGCSRVVVEYGAVIVDKFDPSYDWEEVKRRKKEDYVI